MKREYYKDSIANFLTTSPREVLGALVEGSEFPTELAQRDAWLQQIDILKPVLSDLQHKHDGRIYFECSDKVSGAISRMSDYIKSETLAMQIQTGRDSAEHWEKWDIDGEPCQIGISKV